MKKAAEVVEKLKQKPDDWYQAAKWMSAAGGKDNPYLRHAIEAEFKDSKDLKDTMDALELPTNNNSVSGADSRKASDT